MVKQKLKLWHSLYFVCKVPALYGACPIISKCSVWWLEASSQWRVYSRWLIILVNKNKPSIVYLHLSFEITTIYKNQHHWVLLHYYLIKMWHELVSLEHSCMNSYLYIQETKQTNKQIKLSSKLRPNNTNLHLYTCSLALFTTPK